MGTRFTILVSSCLDSEALTMSEDGSNERRGKTAVILGAFGPMLATLFAATVGLAVLIFLLLSFGKRISPFLLVCLCGALGGFVSSLYRLYRLQELPALLSRSDLQDLRVSFKVVYALVPPLIGLVFAAGLYLAFAGELVEGDLFPSFRCFPEAPRTNCDDSFVGLFSYAPETASQNARALVWGFIAGFLERFFPGVIESLPKPQKA